MTSHVFIVDQTTFPIHLQYLFAGTGSKEKDIDFNNNAHSTLYPYNKYASENSLVGMMADCSRIRKGDYVFFYLQSTTTQEGKFFGVFRAAGEAFLDRNDGSQYLKKELGKSLTFRVRIQPYIVYPEGISEWQALDDIHQLSSPHQMLWSLIYRKLKANRGNTMITIYEAERLINLIRKENKNKSLPISENYDYKNGKIVFSSVHHQYSGRTEVMNILPRLLQKCRDEKQFESHLQMYVVQNIGKDSELDKVLGIQPDKIEWIGNEVSCGVGMQRIDIMVSVTINDLERQIIPIELKATPATISIVKQIKRYIDWIEQYYITNRSSIIQPTIICLAGGLDDQLKSSFREFNDNANGAYLPLKYIEFTISNNHICFSEVQYQI